MIVEKFLEKKQPEVSGIAEIPEDQVELEKGYYCCVYIMLQFWKEVGVYSNEEQSEVEDDPDEWEMYDVNLYDERGRHWRMVLKDKDGVVDNENALLHDKRWDVCMNEK